MISAGVLGVFFIDTVYCLFEQMFESVLAVGHVVQYAAEQADVLLSPA